MHLRPPTPKTPKFQRSLLLLCTSNAVAAFAVVFILLRCMCMSCYRLQALCYIYAKKNQSYVPSLHGRNLYSYTHDNTSSNPFTNVVKLLVVIMSIRTCDLTAIVTHRSRISRYEFLRQGDEATLSSITRSSLVGLEFEGSHAYSGFISRASCLQPRSPPGQLAARESSLKTPNNILKCGEGFDVPNDEMLEAT